MVWQKDSNGPTIFFQLSQAISFQHYNLQNFNSGLFTFGDGFSNNLAYTIGLSRNNTSANPIYPRFGSQFNISAKLTLPYSAFNGVNYGDLIAERDNFTEILANDPTNIDAQNGISSIDQERFKFLEFYKLKFDGTWYTTLAGDLVLRSRAEFGFFRSL